MAEIPQITNRDAWQMLLDDDRAVLIDVRTETEWRTVGVPDSTEIGRPARFIHWTDEQGVANPYFVDRATDGVDPDAPILLLCRSGARSNAAAELLVASGYSQAMNIIGGFEMPQEPGSGWKDQLPSTTYTDGQ